MSPQGGQDPGETVAEWIATGRPSYASVLGALGKFLVAVAEQDMAAPGEARSDAAAPRRRTVIERKNRSGRERFAAPTLPPDATVEDIALLLADTRTRAHQLIDESVTAAQEVLAQRAANIEEGGATAQAQRHAQRLALERIRRSISDLTLEVRGLHGRLDRLEGLLKQVADSVAEGRLEAARHAAEARPAMTEAEDVATALAEEVAEAAAFADEAEEALQAAEAEAEALAIATGDVESPDETPVALDGAPVDEAEPVTVEPAASEATALESRGEVTEARVDEAAEEEAAEAEREFTVEVAASMAEADAEALEAPTSDIEAEPAREERPSAEEEASTEAPVAGARSTEAQEAIEAAVASALLEARRAAAHAMQPASGAPSAAAEAEREPEPEPEPEAPAMPASPAPPQAWTPRVLPRDATAEMASEPVRAPSDAPASAFPPPATPRIERERIARAETSEESAEQPPAEPERAVARLEGSSAAPSSEEPRPAAQARPGLWVPPSAVAPPRPVTPPAAAPAPAREPEASAPVTASAAPPAAQEAVAVHARTATVAPPRVGFEPEDGPVVLRIAPISGFQGLMRVQDAVVQMAPVREATVEAYARGEARLRLQLVGNLRPDDLAESLGHTLGQRARVQSTSDEERAIQVALG